MTAMRVVHTGPEHRPYVEPVPKRKEGSINNGVARYFTGPSFQIGPVWIGITGTQDYSGEVTSETIVIDVPRVIADLDVDRARKLGNAALALADELQALRGRKPHHHERGIWALRSP